MRNRQPTGILAAAFWKNPDVTTFSRVLLVALLGLVPAGYLLAEFYVRAESCVSDTRVAYLLIVGLLFAHAFYFWSVDRPKVLAYFSRMLAEGTLEIKRRLLYHDVYAGAEYRGTFSIVHLPVIIIFYLLILLMWCLHGTVQGIVCGAKDDAGQTFAMLMAGTAFVLVLMHETLLWTIATMSAWMKST